MKKTIKKSAKKSKAIAPVIEEESMVHNTSAAEMPNPAARNRPLRKDVRFAFGQSKKFKAQS